MGMNEWMLHEIRRVWNMEQMPWNKTLLPFSGPLSRVVANIRRSVRSGAAYPLHRVERDWRHRCLVVPVRVPVPVRDGARRSGQQKTNQPMKEKVSERVPRNLQNLDEMIPRWAE